MMHRQSQALLFAAWFCLCSLLAMRADARDGLGPIPTGRGGVNQAFSDNAEMIIDNPSSMVNVEGDGLIELGVATAITTSHYTDSYGNSADAAVRPQPGPVLGITKKLADGRWAIGIGLFEPSSFGADYGELNNPTFGASPLSSRGNLIKLLPAIAFRATDRLSVGMSVGVGLSYASLNGPQFIQSGPLAGTPALLATRGTGVAPVGAVGMQYQLTEKTRIGATYTVQSAFWLHGITNATFYDGTSYIDSRFNSSLHVRWPATVAFGVKHDLCPHRRFAVDLLWTDFSQAYSDLNVVMNNPSNPAVQSLVAGAGGTLPIQQNVPLRWWNTVTLRLGCEADIDEFNVVRCGYDFEPNPVSNATFSPYLSGGQQNVFSLGFSHKLRRAKRALFNAAYQYAFGATRHVGTSDLIGGQFDNSTFRGAAHYATMSLSLPY